MVNVNEYEEVIELDQEDIDILYKNGIISTDNYSKNLIFKIVKLKNGKIELISYKRTKQEKETCILKYCPRTRYYEEKGIKKPILRCKYRIREFCIYRYGLIKYCERNLLNYSKYNQSICVLVKDSIHHKFEKEKKIKNEKKKKKLLELLVNGNNVID